MRRALKILASIVGVLVAIPVLAVLAVLVLANLSVGRNFITATVTRVTGGMVEADGLSGRFPDRLRLRHLAVRDGEGAWLVVENLTLDWSPLDLVHKVAQIGDAERRGGACLPPAGPRSPRSRPRRRAAAAASACRSASCSTICMSTGWSSTRRWRARPPRWRWTAPPICRRSSAAISRSPCSVSTAPGATRSPAASTPPASRRSSRPDEPAGGLIAGLARLPALGALSIQAAHRRPARRRGDHARRRRRPAPRPCERQGRPRAPGRRSRPHRERAHDDAAPRHLLAERRHRGPCPRPLHPAGCERPRRDQRPQGGRRRDRQPHRRHRGQPGPCEPQGGDRRPRHPRPASPTCSRRRRSPSPPMRGSTTRTGRSPSPSPIPLIDAQRHRPYRRRALRRDGSPPAASRALRRDRRGGPAGPYRAHPARRRAGQRRAGEPRRHASASPAACRRRSR